MTMRIQKAKMPAGLVARRGETGSLVALIPAAILIAVVGIGAFAMDLSHNITVRTELQSATDAAALAGARDLLSDATMNSVDLDALNVAAKNNADGVSVSPSTPDMSVTTTWQWDKANNTGTVTVDAQKNINNIFARLFGHKTDAVKTHSVAQAWRSITGIYPNQAFPLMVSLDSAQGNQKPLYQHNVGDTFDIYFNSQQWKNAAWTGLTNNNTNAQWLTSAVDQLFGFSPMQAGFIPGVNIGDNLSLGNGILEQKQLAKGAYENVLTDPNMVLVLPVMLGDPPYNQNRTAVGYVTVRVNSADINGKNGQVETFHVTITKDIVKGTGGIPGSGLTKTTQPGMTNISAGTVKLVT